MNRQALLAETLPIWDMRWLLAEWKTVPCALCRGGVARETAFSIDIGKLSRVRRFV